VCRSECVPYLAGSRSSEEIQRETSLAYWRVREGVLSTESNKGIADHYEAGRDPNAHVQGRAGGGRELRYRLHEAEPSPRHALGIVLVGLRIPEICQHAVTRNQAAISVD
jgi:hypothetical protein